MNFSKKSKALAAGLSLGAWILAAAAPAGAQDASGLEERVRRLEERLREKEGAAAGEGGVAAPQGLYRDSEGFHIGATSLGAYGEAIYNNRLRRSEKDQFDLRRVVLYVGHEFNDEWRFFTEIEFEHAQVLDLEQAFLDWQPSQYLGFQTGLLLVPLGIVNPIHEPTTFYFAERPRVDRVLIPTTFRELGVLSYGSLGDFSYQLGIVNGGRPVGEICPTGGCASLDGFSNNGIRSMQQNGNEAEANDFAVVGRFTYTPVNGLTLGAGAYSGEFDQNTAGAGVPRDARITIAEADVRWQWEDLDIRGQYVATHIGDAAALNAYSASRGGAGNRVPEHMHGGYAEAAYNVLPVLGLATKQKLYAAFRGEWLDLQATLASNGVRDPKGRQDEYQFGLAWKPVEGVVLKADYQIRMDDSASGVANQVNAAAGFSF